MLHPASNSANHQESSDNGKGTSSTMIMMFGPAAAFLLLILVVCNIYQYDPFEKIYFSSMRKNKKDGIRGVSDDYVDHKQIVNDVFQNHLMKYKHSQVMLPQNASMVQIPTKQRPFLFFHNRKAGGSSIRSMIHNSADMMHIPQDEQWIPCQTDPCTPFSFPPYAPKAIYASHINYAHMVSYFREVNTITMKKAISKNKNIVDFSNQTNNEHEHVRYHTFDKEQDFDCITNIRSTVKRVVSCWDYRFVQTKAESWKIPPSSELHPNEWTTLLPKVYDKYNGGCNNELMRIFGDVMDETITNTITVDSPLFITELDSKTSRISKCVIVSTEYCEESNIIVAHFFPWLKPFNLCGTHLNGGQINKTGLMEGAEEAILQQNHMDELVYTFAIKIFYEQLEIAKNGTMSSNNNN